MKTNIPLNNFALENSLQLFLRCTFQTNVCDTRRYIFVALGNIKNSEKVDPVEPNEQRFMLMKLFLNVE